jgi:hypothetical protein
MFLLGVPCIPLVRETFLEKLPFTMAVFCEFTGELTTDMILIELTSENPCDVIIIDEAIPPLVDLLVSPFERCIYPISYLRFDVTIGDGSNCLFCRAEMLEWDLSLFYFLI